MNNKKGVKLLAAVMVFAMAFACVAVVSDDVSAENTIYEVASSSSETQYADIQKAIDAAKETSFTVKLMDDVTGAGFITTSGKNVTIDLNGHTYTINKGVGSSSTETNGMQLLKDSTVSISNGTIAATNVIKILVQNYCDLTLEDVVLDGTNMSKADDAKYILSVNNGNVLIKGGTSFIGEGKYDFEMDYGWSDAYKEPTIEFDKSFTGSIDSFEIARYGTNSNEPIGQLIINGATITGGEFNSYEKQGEEWVLNKNNLPVLGVTLNDGEFGIKAGEIFNGTVTNTIDGKENIVSITNMAAGTGGITFTKGSIVISGTINASDEVIIDATGVVKLNGSIVATDGNTGGLTVTTTENGGKVVIQNLTVSEKSKLTVAGTTEVAGTLKVAGEVDITTGTLAINEKAKLVVSGTVTGEKKITNEGTVQITDPNAKIPSEIGGDGTVDSSGVAVDGTISGEFNTDTTFTQNQVITMTADTYLVDKTVLTIKGKLIIPEGVTLYIRDDARLVVSTSTGIVENNGTIVVESKVDALKTTTTNGDGSVTTVTVKDSVAGALAIINGTLENNGTIDLAYEATDKVNNNVSLNNTGILINNGEIIVGEDSFFYIWNDVKNLGTITVNGTIMADGKTVTGKIMNSGDVVLNGIVEKNKLTIDLQTEDATIQFVSYAGAELEITSSMTKKNIKLVDENDMPIVSVTVKDKFSVSGLVVSAIFVKNDTAEADGSYKYIRNLEMSGDVVFSYDSEVASVDGAPVTITTIGKTTVSETLNLSAGVVLTVNGNMTVSGTVTSITGKILDREDLGMIGVGQNGHITVTGSIVTNKPIDNQKIDAAYYKVAKTITTPETNNYSTLDKAVSAGATKIEMFGNNTVSVDVTVPNGTTVTVSGITTIETDSIVTFSTGAIMKGESVVVKGTFVFEDKKTGDKVPKGSIASEVIKEGEKDRTYTNITSALGKASPGDTVKLSGAANIEKDTVIPEGVTLDTDDKAVTVFPDVTLTVDGTLFINDNGSLTLRNGNPNGTPVTADAKLVLNGTVKSTSAIDKDLEIEGAYYSISEKVNTYYYVQPVSMAAPIIATVDDYTMTIMSFGSDMDIGNISFIGTADDAAVVKIVGKLKAGTVTIDNAKIEFGVNDFTGTIANGVGTVKLEGTSVNGFMISSENVDDVKTLIVTGEFTIAEKKTVTISDDVTFDGFKAGKVTIDGNVIVKKDSTIADLIVNGTITVNNNVLLNAPKLTVNGSVDAKAATTVAAGSVKSTNVLVGVDNKYFDLGANASISGKFDIGDKMFVADGASVPETLVDGKKSLQVFIEDRLWMTVYSMTNSDNVVNIKNVPIENAKLDGWVDKDGKSVTMPVTINDNKVYAKIDYNVYNVKIQVAEGIDDVYMDGVLMDKNLEMKVTAGQHTISYTLANGYGGEATMLVNDEKVTGYTFTASGDFDKNTYKIVLQGIEKTGYTPNAPDNNGGSDGMSITDYLLIVLVVLIVIMAILVAIRMMRS